MNKLNKNKFNKFNITMHVLPSILINELVVKVFNDLDF